ncbi:carbohydrate kinase [Puniceicoccales bacterium CK1056]|uniref:Carbohydrate kinase n=1 Tax=Oceanipulchritudo coccoides TaxID=2706888 RepID=A0A6B2M535_9BACT|nr:FGGY family carbohydrate kinase [Oceanipulchritudo coccoides]NDV63214.1 carbohydrate kinase [Oceanipulchritudo coccoides]
MAQYLGIDSSTQSVSALVFDGITGKVVADASVNFGTDLPQYKAPQGFIPDGEHGEVHSDPLMWLDALDLCLERLLATGVDFRSITAISGAGQQHGTVYLNADGVARLSSIDPAKSLSEQFAGCFSRKTSPIWMDTSTTVQCRAIEKALGSSIKVCKKSGSIAIERFSGPQIRRFFESEKASYVSTAHIHLVSSFMASVLAGTDAPIDHGDGAGMNLLNLETLDWDDDLLEATAPGLREKLPPALPSQTVVGPVAGYFVAKYGFAPSASVVAFTGDNPSSLVGMGATEPGKVIISLGTSDTFFAAMPEPLTDPAGCGHVFGNPLGGFMTLQCFINGSLAREKVRDRLGMDWDQFSKTLEETLPGSDGNRMLPFFGPEISPRVDVKEPVVSGPFADDWVSNPTSARACVEGQFLNMRLCSEWMQLSPDVIYLTGGASQNDAIAQIAADVFQAEVKRLSVPGSVALGGALRAGLATGELSSAVMDTFFKKAISGKAILPDRATSETYTLAAEDIRKLQLSLNS